MDGLAGVLAHELTHFYKHKDLAESRKIEDEAAIGTVDLLVKAGYSPFGTIDALKAFCDYKRASHMEGDCGESESPASIELRKKTMTDYILKTIKEPQKNREYLLKADALKILDELEPLEIPGLSGRFCQIAF